MKVSNLTEELEEKDFFKSFKENERDSFFVAAFLILDLKEKTEKIQLDYFLPSKNKIAGFEYPFSKVQIFEDEIKDMKLQELDLKLDIDDLENKCLEVIEKNNSRIKPTKIIATLKEDIWNLTCMDDMLGIVSIKLNSKTGEEISFSKGSLMDFMGIRKS